MAHIREVEGGRVEGREGGDLLSAARISCSQRLPRLSAVQERRK
jgi:hypothetical protein